MRLKDIAEALDISVSGDGDQEIFNLRYAPEAGEDDLAIARTHAEAEKTRARAVLTNKARQLPGKSLLYYPNWPGKGGWAAALALSARLFAQAGEAPDYAKMPAYRKLPGFPGVMAADGAVIGEGAVIGPNTVIGSNVRIGRNVFIAGGTSIESGVFIGDNTVIDTGARLGAPAFFHYYYRGERHVFCGIGGVYIGSNVTVGANSVIQRGTLSDTHIGMGAKIGSLVVIGHDAKIGKNCLIVSQAGISGEVVMDEGAEVYGQAGIAGRIRLGSHSVVMAQSRISKNVGPGKIISGEYNRSHRAELRMRARLEQMANRKDA